MSRRIVVTGMGAISPLGLDVPSLWDGIKSARSGIAPITLCDTERLGCTFGGEVKGFDPANYMDRKEARRNDRFVQLGLAAVGETLRSAEFRVTPQNAEEIGVVIGSGIGGLTTLSEGFTTMVEKGPSRVSPFLVTGMISNMAAGQVSILHGIKGPSYGTVSACASSAHAIGEAAETIRRGWAKAMLAGGAEAPITRIGIAAFVACRAISTRNDEPATASRPFDATRDGFVLSEGSAMLMLEDLEYAQARGARILAELIGYGLSSDAYHLTLPAEGGEGALRAMRMAVKHAGIATDEIDYVNMHATSTTPGDIAETQAVKTLLGEHAYRIPVSASKSQFGHTLGTAGALEAVVSILAMQNSLIPPTINHRTPDPECDLDYVPNAARPGAINVVLSNSFGFGGHNTALIFRRFA